jgi:hypothetical protein
MQKHLTSGRVAFISLRTNWVAIPILGDHNDGADRIYATVRSSF